MTNDKSKTVFKWVWVGKILPLSQTAEAHRLLEGRKTTGKVVLQPCADA